MEFFASILDGLAPRGSLTPHAQIHLGDKKLVVDFKSNTDNIDQELRAIGTSTGFWRYPGAGHGLVGDDPADTTARGPVEGTDDEVFFKRISNEVPFQTDEPCTSSVRSRTRLHWYMPVR